MKRSLRGGWLTSGVTRRILAALGVSGAIWLGVLWAIGGELWR